MARSREIRVLGLVASLALSAALLVGLFVLSGLSLGALLDAVLATDQRLFLLIVVSSAIHLGLSGYKWNLVTKRLTPTVAGRGGFAFHFFYTALGALFGQILPVQLSTVAARIVGLRLHHGVDAMPGARTSIYEQVFDLLVPLVLVVPSLLFVLGGLGAAGACATAGLALIALALATAWCGPRLGRAHAGTGPDGAGAPAWSARLAAALGAPGSRLDRRFLLQLYGLSVLRFANLVVRAILVAYAVGVALSPEDIAAAMPLVQLSFIVSVTPAGIGLTEWTWSGVLVALGAGFALAGAYALMLRLLVFASIVLVSLLALLLFAWQRPRRSGRRQALPAGEAEGSSAAR